MNGKQSVKLKSDSISFKNYFKQLPVSFKIYADFECIFKKVRGNHKNMAHTQQISSPYSLQFCLYSYVY